LSPEAGFCALIKLESFVKLENNPTKVPDPALNNGVGAPSLLTLSLRLAIE
jgi:hypothetical protein